MSAVTARFVEQDAARAPSQHDRQVSRRCRSRVQLRDRLARRTPRGFSDRVSAQQLESAGPGNRSITGLHTGVTLRDTRHIESSADLMVTGEKAVGVRYDEVSRGVTKGNLHLRD